MKSQLEVFSLDFGIFETRAVVRDGKNEKEPVAFRFIYTRNFYLFFKCKRDEHPGEPLRQLTNFNDISISQLLPACEYFTTKLLC